MRTVGNILWFIFGGFILAVSWGAVGVFCCFTIIAIPIGLQCFKFASFLLRPFGKDMVFPSSSGSFLLNVIWVLIFGWELATISCVFGLMWCITIIGIPFGLQFFKFAKIALQPFGTHIESMNSMYS